MRFPIHIRSVILAFVVISSLIAAPVIAGIQEGSQKTEQSEKISSQVKAFSDSIMIIRSPKQAQEHTNNLLADLGFGAFGTGLFTFGEEKEFSRKKPVIFYDQFWGANGVSSFPIETLEIVESRFDIKPNSIEPTEMSDVSFSGWLGNNFFRGAYGVVNDERLLVGGSEELLREFVKTDKTLADILPAESREFIDNSGMIFVQRVADGDKEIFVGTLSQLSTEGEDKAILEKFNAVAKLAQYGMASFTYEKKTLDFRAQAVFERGKAAGEIFDFEKADKKFQPTLGLPKQNLIAAISFDYRILKSPELSRIIPLALDTPNDFVFFDPRWLVWFQQVFFETWYELDSVRVGVYEVDKNQNGQGDLCILGIIKPKNEKQFLENLQKTFRLVAPVEEPKDEELSAEIAALIKQLGSANYSERQRASNKLLMIGWPAKEQLEKATHSTDPEMKMRARMVFRQLNAESENAKRALADPTSQFAQGFSPSFALTGKSTELAGLSGHLIHFDLAAKTDEQKTIREIVGTAFGDQWQKIEVYQLEGHYLFMIGSDRSVLEKSIKLFSQSKNPIAESRPKHREAFVGSPVAVHFSLARINNILEDNEDNYFDANDDEISAFGMKVSPDIWEAIFLYPVSELNVLIKSRLVGFGAGR